MDLLTSLLQLLCLATGLITIVRSLECYSCPQQEVCLGRFPQWPGRCRAGDGGKCFIRNDPNGRQYWGCVDKEAWPTANIRNGCWVIPYFAYRGRPVTWCFCDGDLCNTNITHVLKNYIAYPTVPVTGRADYRLKTYSPTNGIQNDQSRARTASAYVREYTPFGRSTRKESPSRSSRYNVATRREEQSLHEEMRDSDYSTQQQVNADLAPLPTQSRMRQPEGKSVAKRKQLLIKRDCRFGNGRCDHVCTPGQNTWYGTCSCKRGYELGADGSTCKDIDECASPDNGGCEMNCVNTAGGYSCECKPGYRTSQEGRICEEINECSEGNSGCSHQCVNTPGSFICHCPPGMELQQGDNRTCRDLNECMAGIAKCEQLCNNTIGSFSCDCSNGYTLNVDEWSCNDIDECATDKAGCAQQCINTRGSFSCACEVGQILDSDGIHCLDENECLWNKGGCDQFCKNTHGSFICSCAPGYELNADRKTCNEAHTDSKCYADNGGCQHICTTLDEATGRMQCSCNPGYMLHTDQKTCVDINECREKTDGCDQLCENTEGSFKCACRPGFKLDPDGIHCVDDDECGFDNGGCAHICENEHGSRTCSCESGYELGDDGKSCNDLNECLNGGNQCHGDCVNVLGSYHCGCPDGMSLNADQKSCDDVDECQNANGGCEQLCVNTDGSYYCTCKAGFTIDFDNRTCYDFNECRFQNGLCEQICENTHGSYQCRCDEGYTMDLDGHSCNDIDECNTAQHACAEKCSNLPGTYECGCKEGYRVASDAMSCEDDNECLVDNGGCDHNCTNTEGSFICGCKSMYALGPDLKTCTPKCPIGFKKLGSQQSCYRIQSRFAPRSHSGAESYCQILHHEAHLATVDTSDEREMLAEYLESFTDASSTLKGWWVGAKYMSNQGQFVWTHTFQSIPLNHANWGVRQHPYEKTCIWLMHGSSYAHTLSNVDCSQPSAFICEIELPSE